MSETKSHTCQCRACKDGTDPQIARRHEQINLFLGRLSEPQRRWHVALMVQEPGSPNHYQLSLITGLDEKTIKRGQQELEEGLVGIPQCRQRRVGGGRLRSEKNPKLEPVLLEIVSPRTAGNPMNGQKWLNCRLRDIQEQLEQQEHGVSLPVVSRLLRAHDYHLRSNRKETEGKQHPDRNRQFEYIQEQSDKHKAAGQPVLSVDTKKKELIGDFKNAGQIWCQEPEQVNVHDFKQDAIGKAVPYGLYDEQHNRGTIYVGQSADTATFAVDNIAHWCATEMRERFSETTQLLIKADNGGSNGSRLRVWKQQLQEKVADAFGLTVTVCHYPTGTSKWNPIEHRLFSEISKTWAGCPLRTFDIALGYIRDTKTETGLKVQAHLVTGEYVTGVKVSKSVMASLNLKSHEVCPQWNYISPRPKAAPLG